MKEFLIVIAMVIVAMLIGIPIVVLLALYLKFIAEAIL